MRAAAASPRASRPVAALALSLLIAAGGAGCAAWQRQPAPADAARVAGRLSLQVAGIGDEPARGFTGQFELRGDASAGALEISGPLGATLVRAQWAGGRYRLDEAQGSRSFGSLDELARVALGEPLPLEALFDWLRQRPWPGAPHAPRSDGLAGFEQLGWTIDLQDASSGLLRAQRHGSPALSLRVRLDGGAAS